MAQRLRDAVSPYLRAHAENPVDWWQWGPEAFAEAQRRGVPVLISIGYATCHWCHVMARESFSDAELGAWLNDRFVAIKVDREEHPEVDTAYLAAASAFSSSLGWPLTVFATPEGRVFYAGTYFPPTPRGGMPSFRQVLDAVLDAWGNRNEQVELSAAALSEAVRTSVVTQGSPLPGNDDFADAVTRLHSIEDAEHGGFGTAPKFPVATVLLWLLDRAALGDDQARGLAERTLDAMAASPLRDPVEGGFFRYATRADWSEPHYERMLTDNALLLSAYARAGRTEIAEGIAAFLLEVLRLPRGFASAQDSESLIEGERMEGVYYRLHDRSGLEPPALDDKVLTGWNGLAIEALALAGSLLDRPDWIAAAVEVADTLLRAHRHPDGMLVRASSGDRTSSATATLEDYGMLAGGLVQLTLATGEVRHAIAARELIEQCLNDDARGVPLRAPAGADPLLERAGLAVELDPNEGAVPSGLSAAASAALRLHLLGGDPRLRERAEAAMARLAALATGQPMAFGRALAVMSALTAPPMQLVVVTGEPEHGGDAMAAAARRWVRPGTVSIAVTPEQCGALAAAGFELFEERARLGAVTTAYLCEDFACRMPVTEAALLTLP